MSLRRVWLVAAWMAGSWIGAAGAEGTEVAATWKRYELDFHYMGFTTRYSCEGLRDKVRQLLLHSGVRKDLKISARGCERSYGRIADFPSLRIVFWAPELPEVGRRDVGEPATARWRRVTITRNQPRGLEPGDCELVELFRDRLLPELTARVISDETNCIPHQLVGTHVQLEFEVLEGLPPPDLAGNNQR